MTKATEEQQRMLVILATEHYVAGRFAAMAGLAPVFGNLLHHAVEYYLKAALAKTSSLAELKGFRHNLRRLWQAFKQTGPAGPSPFESLIDALDPFESIRYPDLLPEDGMLTTVLGPGLQGAGLVFAARRSQRPRKYEVRVADVDRLVIEGIWPALFPEGFVPTALGMLTKDGQRALRLRNGPLRKRLSG